MRKNDTKKMVNQLITLAGEIDNLNGLTSSNPQVRAQIMEVIKLATEIGFTRQNVDKKIVLFWGNGPLSEVVEISAFNGKVCTSTDRLWGTICGHNEQIQEMEAHERELRYEMQEGMFCVTQGSYQC